MSTNKRFDTSFGFYLQINFILSSLIMNLFWKSNETSEIKSFKVKNIPKNPPQIKIYFILIGKRITFFSVSLVLSCKVQQSSIFFSMCTGKQERNSENYFSNLHCCMVYTVHTLVARKLIAIDLIEIYV